MAYRNSYKAKAKSKTVLAPSNVHLADRLAEIREQMRVLKTQEDAVREGLLRPGADLRGDAYMVVIQAVTREKLNLDKVRRVLTPEQIIAFTEESTVTYVRVKPKLSDAKPKTPGSGLFD